MQKLRDLKFKYAEGSSGNSDSGNLSSPDEV